MTKNETSTDWRTSGSMTCKGRTVGQVIYHHYAKLIASAILDVNPGNIQDAHVRKRFWGLVRNRYAALLSGDITMSSSSKEFKKLVEGAGNRCVYCGATEDLEWDHVIPLSRGGPNTPDNLVRACAHCNRSKGNKTPSEFYSGRWHEIPRIVEGLYLKLLFDAHKRNSKLDAKEFPAGVKPRISTLALIFANNSTRDPIPGGA